MAFDPASSDFVVYLALFTLYIGIFLLMLPLLNHLWEKWLRFMDGQVMLSLVIVMVFAALILTTQGLKTVQDNPWLLFPLGFFTVLFRLLSPSFLLKGLSGRLGPATNKPWWVDNALVGGGLGVGGYTLFTALRSHFGWGGGENNYAGLLMLVAVVYSFSRFYLFIFLPQMKESKTYLTWVAGLIIGVSFVLMVPYLLPEFTLIFGLAGAFGWWLAALLFYFERRNRFPRLLRLLGFG